MLSQKYHAWLKDYRQEHQLHSNQLCHLVGIPLVALGFACFLSWPEITLYQIPPAIPLFALLWIFELALNFRKALWVAPLYGLCLILAHQLSQLPLPLFVMVTLFINFGAWAIQLYGHRLEKNRPALLKNLFQFAVAPLFWVEELERKIGKRTGD